MPGLRRFLLGILFPASAVFVIAAGPNYLKSAKQKLSDYRYFQEPAAEQDPVSGIIPYRVSSELFSDYAEKLRFIVVPTGEKLTYNSDGSFDFPIGTTLIKTFYYPSDFRNPDESRKLLETRLLIHTETGWIGLPYVWNAEQTDAVLEIAGERIPTSFINTQGRTINVEYSVPNVNQCKGCHVYQNIMQPIGPKVRLLNCDFDYPEGRMNQLEKWQELGIVEIPEPVASLDKTPNYEDPTDGTVTDRVRAWIDINCAHCHRLGAPGETSGLFLNVEENDLRKLGVYKPPVAAGRGSGNLSYTIVPGKPEKSIMVFRMESADPGIMMPELSRKLVHKEGVQLVKDWIRSMDSADFNN